MSEHYVIPVTKLDSHYTCYYCKLEHKRVEAGGIHHCPNVLCTGPGASYWRSKLESHQDHGSTQSVNALEAYTKGLEYAREIEATEPEIAAAIFRSSASWLDFHNAGMV